MLITKKKDWKALQTGFTLKGGVRALITLCKEFKLLDFIGSNKLTIDDFIIIISDIQLLFKFIWKLSTTDWNV